MNKEQYRIRFSMKAEGDEAEVMIYSEISDYKFWGDEVTTSDFDKALKEARKSGATKLNVRVNSPGGDVYSAVAMRSMIINAGFDHVRVMIEGLCASAATLFATVPGAQVVIAEGSEFMIHNPMTIAWGSATELMKTVDHLHKLEEQFHGMYAAKTGESEEQIAEWMDAETWFTAKEACHYGFCDELLESAPVAAAVSPRELDVMRAIYRFVPEAVVASDESKEVSNGTPDGTGDEAANHPTGHAGSPTEINKHEEDDSDMDIKDINLEQLRAENPALLAQIQQSAVSDERQRIEDIDALTLPGYEAMAAEAKANGTSAMDFQRQVVQAQKQKGADFMAGRKKETGPAGNVAGGSAEDGRSEDDEIDSFARDIAAYAQAYRGDGSDGMF